MLKVLHGVIDANKEPLFLSVNVEKKWILLRLCGITCKLGWPWTTVTELFWFITL